MILNKGERFGRWEIIKISEIKMKGSVYYTCVCDCGTIKNVSKKSLVSGISKSCGCLRSEFLHTYGLKHGMHKERIYYIWKGMKLRCSKNAKCSKNYFYRDVTVCEEWKRDFTTFLYWAKSNGYSDEKTIDRIDNDLGYCPENCRFVSVKENNRNKRNNVIIEINGESKTMAEWAELYNINYNTFAHRVRSNWPTEKLLQAVARQHD